MDRCVPSLECTTDEGLAGKTNYENSLLGTIVASPEFTDVEFIQLHGDSCRFGRKLSFSLWLLETAALAGKPAV